MDSQNTSFRKKITILTGAGISAESGLKTFRDANGLWEGHDVMAVASPEGWQKDQELVLDFYNQRRKQLLRVKPNPAHEALVKLEQKYDVTIVTQNIDNLHEKAGSAKVLHLHGELLKVRSTLNENYTVDWTEDLHTGDCCPAGSQLRPHVVWFGEDVPKLEEAVMITAQADHIIIIGTSMQVYPAASLINFAKENAQVYFIDPKPSILPGKNLEILATTASAGVPIVVDRLLSN
ncbi:MAG: NAD-dependent deacylase [Leeuwenhoekiella sp.]